MHCHLIVSRKDQFNKKRSPLTNHKNTKKRVITGGFNQKNLFQQTEQGLDKRFGYKRELTESFEYHNTMKNGRISERLNMQEREIASEKENMQAGLYADKLDKLIENKVACKQDDNLSNNTENRQSFNLRDLGLSSVLGLFTFDFKNNEEQQISVKRKESGVSAVVLEVISRTYVGYFSLMTSLPFGRRKPTGITNGTRITSTVVGL